MRKLLMIATILLLTFIPIRAFAACPFVNDDFNDGVIASGWTLTELDGAIVEQNGVLQIASGSGDIWGATFTPTMAMQCVQGDFDISTKVTAAVASAYDQAGILYITDQGSTTADIIQTPTGIFVQRRETIDGQTWINQIAVTPGASVWFRIKAVGSILTSYYALMEPAQDSDWIEISDKGCK